MLHYRKVVNFLFVLGVSPFLITFTEVKVFKLYPLAMLLKVSCCLGAYIYILLFNFTFPDRVDVSYLSIMTVMVTNILDFVLLQAINIFTYKSQRLLFIRLVNNKKEILNVTNSVALTVGSTSKGLLKETAIKLFLLISITLGGIIGMVLILDPEVDYVLMLISFLIMFFTMLFQFIYKRIYLVLLLESIDRYSEFITAENISTPTIMARVGNLFNETIIYYNQVFKYQNLILVQWSFIILLIFCYFATISISKYDVLLWLSFIPILSYLINDIVKYVATCHSIHSKIRKIQLMQGRHLKADSSTVGFTFLMMSFVDNETHSLFNYSISIYVYFFCKRYPH